LKTYKLASNFQDDLWSKAFLLAFGLSRILQDVGEEKGLSFFLFLLTSTINRHM